MNSIFSLCVQLLERLAKVFHTSYTSISVVFNIYLQGIVLLIPAIWVFSKLAIKMFVLGLSMKLLCLLVFVILQIVMILIAFIRYRPPLYKAFNCCVSDLQNIAGRINLSYQMVNVIIFIVAYLACLWLNIFLITRM